MRWLAVVWLLFTGCGAREQPPHDAWDLDGDRVVRIAVLGDSNSFILFPHGWTLALRRHLRKSEPGRWRIYPYARPGARITDHPPDRRLSGSYQLEQAETQRPRPDLILLAFGTNDHRDGRTATEILAAYQTAATRLGTFARVRIATTPPCWEERCDPAAIAASNRILREAWPAEEVVDFDSGIEREDLLPDLVHLNPQGHRKRLAAVLDALFERAPATRDAGAPPLASRPPPLSPPRPPR